MCKSKVTVVVVTYNSEATIRNCLSSFSYIEDKFIDFDVVVVDNASTDKTREIVAGEFKSVKLITNNKNVGFGSANNIGMKNYSADYYYLHNADAYLQSDVITPAVDAFQKDASISIVGFRLVFPDGSPQSAAFSFSTPVKLLLQELGAGKIAKLMASSSFGKRFLLPALSKWNVSRPLARLMGSDKDASKPIEQYDWVCGASLMLSHQTLLQTDGFDEEIFLYGEDEDLCARTTGRVVQLNTVPVIHDFGWGKSGMQSALMRRLKYDGMSRLVRRRYAMRPISRSLMLILLKARSRA